MSDALTLTAHDVAALLSLTKDDFLRRRPRLMRAHGVPRVLPGLGRVWARAAVEAWIAAHGARTAGETEPDAGAPAVPRRREDPVDFAMRRLEARYAGGGI